MNDNTFTHLATVALRSYGLHHAQLMRLGGSDNINFRVDVDATSYVLHLHTSPRHNRAALASELAWLHSLHTDTSLVLPQPVANLHDQFVTGVAVDGTTETLCTLMSWIEGQLAPTSDALMATQLAHVGALMAHLHRHAQQFEVPAGFTRHTFDAAHFWALLEVLHAALSTTDLDQRDLHTFKTTADHLIVQANIGERTPDTFGMIHADFHSGNYVLHNDEVRLIDFDRCGFGWYLYDLALALMELREHQRSVFVQGYETVASLPVDHERRTALFGGLAYLDNLGFLAANPEEHAFIVQELPFAVEALRRAVEIMP